MRYKLLGKTGLRVSELCLGAMTFGNSSGWGASQEQSQRVFDAFVAAGGNFIDTAPGYQGGESEELLSKFIAGARDRYVIATKFSLGIVPGDPNSGGNGRKNMMRMVHNSLRRLQTDYIDLYWMHAWDGITPEEEVLRGLDDLVRAGKILHIGFSDTPAWVIARSQTFAELKGWSSLAAIQLRYSLMDRSPDRELLPMAAALGLSVLIWGSLGAGLLSAKYRWSNGSIVGDGRLSGPAYRDNPIPDATVAIIRGVASMAVDLGISPAQLALSWIRSRSNIMIPIVGARTMEQLAENLKCLDVLLDEAQMAKLDLFSSVSSGFPTDFLQGAMINKLLFGDMRESIEARSRLLL
jgi:aryl-alcohol dehydrogenase-like predicted oxidoreductase